MDENLNPEPKANSRQTFQHAKKLRPLNPDIQPEKNVSQPPIQQTQPEKTELSPQTSGSIQVPPQVSDKKPNWVGKIPRLLITGVVGAFVGVSYFYYLDGNEDFFNRGDIALRHYSPTILFDTIITTIVLMLVYGLALRFIFRSKHAAGQSVFAILACQLLIIIFLGITHFNNQSISIFGGVSTESLIVAACIGVVVFTATNYIAQRAWNWKVPRLLLAVPILLALTIASFGLSQVIGHRYTVKQQEEIAISDQAKAQSDKGIYDFNADYKQYYPSDAIQSRFKIVRIAGNSTIKSKDNEDYPHITLLEFKDKNYKGTNDALTISMYQSKPGKSYNPPNSCGNPNPYQDYFEQKSRLNDSRKECFKIKDVPGVGVLYGRDQYPGAFNSERVSDAYDWYYIKYGDTLVTLDTIGTINGNDAALLITSLKPISPNELLAKSRALVNL